MASKILKHMKIQETTALQVYLKGFQENIRSIWDQINVEKYSIPKIYEYRELFNKAGIQNPIDYDWSLKGDEELEYLNDVIEITQEQLILWSIYPCKDEICKLLFQYIEFYTQQLTNYREVKFHVEKLPFLVLQDFQFGDKFTIFHLHDIQSWREINLSEHQED